MKTMKELVAILNAAAEAYYNGEETMSNKEYDSLFDELVQMEHESGEVLPDSPTRNVGAPVAVDSLHKSVHEYPALSLDKTKNAGDIKTKYMQAKPVQENMPEAVIMWKLDGSTLQLTYDDGILQKAVTRGNGETGQDVSHNARFISGIPVKIPFKGHLVVRGEALMSYREFERLNSDLPDEEKYKNPRNLANASIQMLDSREMRKRSVCFFAFGLVAVHSQDGSPSMQDMPFSVRLGFLASQGFQVVRHEKIPVSRIEDAVERWTADAASGEMEFPVDGLVFAYEDAPYADRQPGTGHHPNILAGYAFKWADETAETVLRKIEWSPSRTGLLNPVAVFDPVELCGTTVSRASLHNFSQMRKLRIRPGNTLSVYKANMIIPQIDCNMTMGKEYSAEEVPELIGRCPVCGSVPQIKDANGVETVYCVNSCCPARHVKKFVHFAERDCMDITGISEAAIERFVDMGFLHEFADFYRLDQHKDEIIAMEGFGEKSWTNLWNAIQKSRKASFIGFIHALGIPNIGKGQAKLLYRFFEGDFARFYDVVKWCCGGRKYDFTVIEGFGEVLNDSLNSWIQDEHASGEMYHLLEYVTIEAPESPLEKGPDSPDAGSFTGMTFVITGAVNHFKNRDAVKEYIESRGGKTSGSVSKKTTFLVNNDVESNSTKNQKAKEYGIKIISEEELLAM